MAKEYIEREAAYQTLTEYYHHTTEGMHSALREAISRVPAADVRPVVLCKDCKYNKGTKTWIDNDLTADCTNGHGYPLLDWFCADGVKREES